MRGQTWLLCAALGVITPFWSAAGAREIQVTPDNIDAAWKTIQPGDRVVFLAGEYRLELRLPPGRAWSAGAPTTFVAAKPGTAIVKGSDLAHGWQADGAGHYAKSWPTEPSQVFIDGQPLVQLGGTLGGKAPDERGDAKAGYPTDDKGIWPGRVAYAPGDPMPPGSFYYDGAARRLVLGVENNPDAHKVEVSVRPHTLYAEAANGIVLDGLVFEHSNTSLAGRGASVTLVGNDNIVRNVTVRAADLVGLQTVGDRNQVLDSRIERCGQLGVNMRGHKNRVAGVEASYNNTRGFNKWWEAGGFKFVGEGGLQSSEFVGNRAVGNLGDGIWFDWKNSDNLVRGNVSAYNTGFGIHYEVSRGGVIQDNYVFGNGQRGIYISDSSFCWVTHNLVVGNGGEGIVAVYTHRKDNEGAEFGGEDNRVFANIVAWNKMTALIMPKGAAKPGSADRNVYLAAPQSLRFSLGFSGPLGSSASLEDWSRSSGHDARSSAAERPMPPELADALARKSTSVDWTRLRADAESLRKSEARSPTGLNLPGGGDGTLGPRPTL